MGILNEGDAHLNLDLAASSMPLKYADPKWYQLIFKSTQGWVLLKRGWGLLKNIRPVGRKLRNKYSGRKQEQIISVMLPNS